MRQLLSTSLLRDALSRLEGWTGDAGGITRTLHLTDGAHAELVERVKVCADALDHHPRIARTGTQTRVWLRTDALGGVTTSDVILAARIDRILRVLASTSRS